MSFPKEVQDVLEASEKPLTSREIYEQMDSAETTTQVSIALHDLRKRGVVGRIEDQKPAPHFVVGSKADPSSGEPPEPDPDSKSTGNRQGKNPDADPAKNPETVSFEVVERACQALGLRRPYASPEALMQHAGHVMAKLRNSEEEVEKLKGANARYLKAREVLQEKEDEIKGLQRQLDEAKRRPEPQAAVTPPERLYFVPCPAGQEVELTRVYWDKKASHYALQDDGSLVLFLWDVNQMVRVHPGDTERLRRLLNGWSELVERAQGEVAAAAAEEETHA